ncbi:type II secretion system F family protein [Massilia genomosp. 1]|uniref:type II secretion system F family protein n=1 Tax=Massilia genomosp. 1 TaxID=2609280 RepID=UPI001E44C49B|nr:type II secretion system F family protein [Massilia genomosp. 1]
MKPADRTTATPSSSAVPGTVTPALRWRLTVETADGRTQTLELADMPEAEAVRRAAARGLRVLGVEALGAVSAASAAQVQFPLILFSQELLALLDAGLNLTEALSTLQAKERSAPVRAVHGQLLQSLREGRTLSDVLEAAPQYFSEVYVATVRASERTGDLPQALGRYIAYQTQFETLRKKLASTAIYPAMLLLVGGFVTLFLLGYVVPRFAVVYESSGRDIPWLSAMLLAFGKLIYQNWQVALLLVLSGFGTLGWAASRPQGRAWLLACVLRLPWLAARADEYRLARFYRAVSLLLSSGVSLARAMGMVGGLLGSHQQASLAACRLAVEQGRSLSSALVDAGLASAVAESLVKVGERSGQMAEMLERAARFADDEFSRWIDWASRLLEPVLMVVIGLVIGTVVVLMYMPIFDLAGSLQ